LRALVWHTDERASGDATREVRACVAAHERGESSMPLWVVFTVQWLHVVSGITWFGGILFIALVLLPTLRLVAPADQRAIVSPLAQRIIQVYTVAALSTVILGILRGTVFGQITTFDILFGTTYGLTWIAAFILGIVTILCGIFLVGMNLQKLSAIAAGGSGTSDAAFTAQWRVLTTGVYITLVAFAATFSCMILMRFGL
jgi:uncharacterized membrane protein